MDLSFDTMYIKKLESPSDVLKQEAYEEKFITVWESSLLDANKNNTGCSFHSEHVRAYRLQGRTSATQNKEVESCGQTDFWKNSSGAKTNAKERIL